MSLKNGDKVRMNSKLIKALSTSKEHLDEFKNCVGVMLLKVNQHMMKILILK